MSKRSVKRTQREEKSRAESEEGLKVPWSQSRLNTFERSFIPLTQKGPEDLPSWNSVWYTIGAQWWLYTHKPFCVLRSRHQLGAKMDSHTHGVLGPATGGWQGVGLSRIYHNHSAFLPNERLILGAVGVCNYCCTPSNSSSTCLRSLSGFERDLTYPKISL